MVGQVVIEKPEDGLIGMKLIINIHMNIVSRYLKIYSNIFNNFLMMLY